MDGNKRPSGAEFRKRRKHEEEKIKKLPKIDTFFVKKCDFSGDSASQSDGVSERECEGDKSLEENDTLNFLGDDSKSEVDQNVSTDLNTNFNAPSTSSTVVNSIVQENVENIDNSNDDATGKFNTDIALFSEDEVKKDEFKSLILNSEPCRPQGPFPKDPKTNRSFSKDYYFCETKTGQKIERFWLCYSPVLNGVYCEPCWLFANRLDKNFNKAWSTGKINDWGNLSSKIKDHEWSKCHTNACKAYGIRKSNRDIKVLFYEKEEKMLEVIKRILDVIITMSTCNLAFRGHRSESIKSISSESGNFLNIIDLLSRYDPILKSHLENEGSRIKYLSPTIQNELIHLASHQILSEILSEVQQSSFFSLILDTTQDISKIDQLSIILRYVSYKPDINQLKIIESFLGFVQVSKQSAEGLEEHVVKFLEEKKISLDKCRGQGYDGASVMSGIYTGLQARIKSKSPTAEYVHCANHNLNLVLNDSVKSILEISVFYDIINSIYVFFSQSLPRWQSLAESTDTCIINLTLKKLCPIRWSSRYDALLAINVNFVPVMKCLTKIILASNVTSEVVEATGLRKQMASFDFVLMLVFQSRVLERIQITSKSLQRPDINLDDAKNLLQKSLNTVRDLRGQFDDVVDQARKLAAKWNIDPSMNTKRNRRVKTFFDELAKDYEFSDPLYSFKIKVFLKAIDILISQLNDRFKSTLRLVDTFSFLKPENLLEFSDEQLIDSASGFCKKYESDVTAALANEVICFRNFIKDDIKSNKISKISQLADYLLIKNKFIASSVPNICTAFIMFITLPVTVASSERSFSKLKIIKSYLRNSMSGTRLCDLSIISIEHERSRCLDLDKLARQFLQLKSRRGFVRE